MFMYMRTKRNRLMLLMAALLFAVAAHPQSYPTKLLAHEQQIESADYAEQDLVGYRWYECKNVATALTMRRTRVSR
jgi:hypothetical protein